MKRTSSSPSSSSSFPSSLRVLNGLDEEFVSLTLFHQRRRERRRSPLLLDVVPFGPAFIGPIISEFAEVFLEGEGGFK